MAVTGTPTAKLQVAAIVLAAGGSRRMGAPKQLLPVDGQPMVRHVVETVCAAGLAQVVVVVGARARPVAQALAGLPIQILFNESWARGMSDSLKTGLDALRPEIQAALIVLADQPGLTADLLQSLITRYQSTQARLVAPYYQGRRGNPVLFDRVLFQELRAVDGDRGGRDILQQHRDSIEQVDVDTPSVLMDVDTFEDYERLPEHPSHSGSNKGRNPY
jgi:molybdenum cofactor cytidylyltransferase